MLGKEKKLTADLADPQTDLGNISYYATIQILWELQL